MNPFLEIKQRIKDFFDTHRNLLAPAILLGGFVADWFTLTRIDQVFDNVIFIIHLTLSGLAIVFLHATDSEYLQYHSQREKFRKWGWGIMLFSFGALYSGFFIFYLRSASFVTSWAIVMGLLAIMVSTEWKRDVYIHRTVQIGVYYLALLCYFIFLVPILANHMGAGIFIMSTILSLAVGGLFVFLLWFLDEDGIERRRIGIFSLLLGTALVMNFLYFTNIIPPIPLSLQDTGVYLSLERRESAQGLSYIGGYQEAPWYNIFRTQRRIIPWQPGKDIYVFGAVFAPYDIETQIRHCWEYFDTYSRSWERAHCIPIPIIGGRDGGYRGYSQKTNVWKGLWRVRFLTQRNQSLGVVRFQIIQGNVPRNELRYEML